MTDEPPDEPPMTAELEQFNGGPLKSNRLLTEGLPTTDYCGRPGFTRREAEIRPETQTRRGCCREKSRTSATAR